MPQQPERILTLHPEKGKGGPRITRDKYYAMKKALLKVIPRKKDGVRFLDLSRLVKPHLSKKIYGLKVSVPSYVITVKLDLEARRLIERVPDAKPQRIRRKAVSR